MRRLFGELLDNPFPNYCQYWQYASVLGELKRLKTRRVFNLLAPFAFDQR